MGKMSFWSLTVLGLVGVANAKPAPAPVLEPVQVTKVSQSGDFMPGPGASRRKPTTTLSLVVQTNGCTTAKDFEAKVKQVDDQQHVTIVRIKDDLCRGIMSWAPIELETDAIGLSSQTWTSKSPTMLQSNPIHISNPVPVEDNTTH